MWQCNKCKRNFQKTNQSHSCRPPFPIEKHFEGKPEAKELYDHLKEMIAQEIGPFTIDSPECCIHFVRTTTFCACWAVKGKIRIDFSLPREEKIERANKMAKLSANRFIYYIDIANKAEIDKELLGWIKESYHLK